MCGTLEKGLAYLLVLVLGNEGMNLGIPLKKATSWIVFVGVIQFLIPCISHKRV